MSEELMIKNKKSIKIQRIFSLVLKLLFNN